MIMVFRCFSVMLLTLLLIACHQKDDLTVSKSGRNVDLTVKDAIKFVAQSERQLEGLLQENERMAWVYSNFITEDTEYLAATSIKKFTLLQVQLCQPTLLGKS